MRRALIGLVALLVGCGSPAIRLLTVSHDGCYLWHAVGQLVVDPKYGTAIVIDGTREHVPVSWPAGFSGRFSGGEIEVVSPVGGVVAVTGRRYYLDGGYSKDSGVGSWWTCAETVVPK